MDKYDVDVFVSVAGTVRGISAPSPAMAKAIAEERLRTGEGIWNIERRLTPRKHQPPVDLRAGTLHMLDAAGKSIAEIPVHDVKFPEIKAGKHEKPKKKR